ncbi:unnamed protein product, partial [Rotaria sp. Silwood1]
DRQVIHRWGENDGVGKSIGVMGNIKTIFGVNFDKATILQSHISDVLKHGGKVRVNNYRDAIWEPQPVTIIVQSSRLCIGQEGYNLIYNNCEHFATNCRYGEPYSRQVRTVARSIAAGLVIASLLGAAAYGFNRALKSEEIEEEEEKETKEKKKPT